jgi:hypothetical protein
VGHPLTITLLELDDVEIREEERVVVTVVSVVTKLVGLTGGTGWIEVVDAGQLTEPHERSVGQHPPPSVAGQDLKPEEHVRGGGGIEV